MQVQNYERLSKIYDLDWGDFSLQYVRLITYFFTRHGIQHSRLLDVACGTGTLAKALSERGHSVHGIDNSPAMIARAREKTEGLPCISFDVQNMVSFETECRFDFATCTFDAINYLLNPSNVLSMFSCVSASLHQGALFFFDSNTPHLYLKHKNKSSFYELGQQKVIQKLSYSRWKKRAKTIFDFTDGTTEVHLQRPYTLKELTPLLEKTGFHIVDVFSDFDMRNYFPESERLILVGEKMRKSNKKRRTPSDESTNCRNS
jgi:SAM-dependent methyltransferase